MRNYLQKGKVTDVEERDKIPTKPNDLVTAMTKYYDGKLSTFEWDAVKMEGKIFIRNPFGIYRSM